MNVARELWKRIETIHAVTYFADESIAAAKAAGLRGFWMGYFGFRAAPLGAVGPEVVGAAFANFEPSMVRRALPDAWDCAQPTDLVAVRADAAATVLRRLQPDVDGLAASVNPQLSAVADAATHIGRPLFAANRAIASFDDPVAELWQLCTTLREHRGDGHVLALATAGIDGCEAHRLLVADQDLPTETFQGNRGWTDEDWEHAGERLRERGLLETDVITAAGRRLRVDVETRTDALALEPFTQALTASQRARLVETLTPAARVIAGSGIIPYPNPMGLPSLLD